MFGLHKVHSGEHSDIILNRCRVVCMVSNMVKVLFSFSLNLSNRSSLVRNRSNFANGPITPFPLLIRLLVERYLTHNWTAERMFLKFDIRSFYEKLSSSFSLD